MNPDLFLAILSMDSYNRGYGQGIKAEFLPAGSLGNARILNQELLGIDAQKYQNWQSAGFYAIAYKVAGKTVIAYRGSDNIDKGAAVASFLSKIDGNFLTNNPTDEDITNGYGVALGYPNGPQAKLAIEFYKAVAGSGGIDPATRTSNISVTGHSLGAGLSGLVAGIYNLQGTHFDPMSFGLALDTVDLWAFAPPVGSPREFIDLVYGGAQPWATGLPAAS